MGTLHKDQYTFLIISRPVLLRMTNLSDRSCRDNQNTHFMFNPPPKVAQFMRYVEKYCTAGQTWMTIWGTHSACWIPKATNSHTVYVILIAFQLQKWLHDCTSILHYWYTACLVPVMFVQA